MFWLGISNGDIPGNKSTFPPEFREGSRLHYYSSLFNTIEVNRSFYKPQRPRTYEKWTTEVPEQFQFTLKFPRDISHNKNNEIDMECLSQFMHTATHMGTKRGCILLQFPGKTGLDFFTTLERILSAIKDIDKDSTWRIAVEWRNTAWEISEVFELLDEYDACPVIHDKPLRNDTLRLSHDRIAGNFSPQPSIVEQLQQSRSRARHAYVRLHGPAGDYRGSYSQEFLETLADALHSATHHTDTYIYFNNTAGDAFENARLLQQYLQRH